MSHVKATNSTKYVKLEFPWNTLIIKMTQGNPNIGPDVFKVLNIYATDLLRKYKVALA
jgi:hypothetical protein